MIRTRDLNVIPFLVPLLQDEIEAEGKHTLQNFLKWYRRNISEPFCYTFIDHENEKFAILLVSEDLNGNYINLLYSKGDVIDEVIEFAKKQGIKIIKKISKTQDETFELDGYVLVKEV